MANEIKLGFTLSVANGEYSNAIRLNKSYTQSTIGAAGGIAVVTTSESNMSLGSVGTAGQLVLHNLDSTNHVDYGLDDSGTMKAIGRIEPGELHYLRLKPAVNLRWKANGASVKVEYWLLED